MRVFRKGVLHHRMASQRFSAGLKRKLDAAVSCFEKAKALSRRNKKEEAEFLYIKARKDLIYVLDHSDLKAQTQIPRHSRTTNALKSSAAEEEIISLMESAWLKLGI